MAATLILYADGSCSGNPGPGAWAVLLIDPNNQKCLERVGTKDATTNNEMELQALIEGLKMVGADDSLEVRLDSQYVIKGATLWRKGWKAKGWVKADGEPVKNLDYWKELDAILNSRFKKPTFTYVAGHSGEPGNDRVDRLAQSAAKTQGSNPETVPFSGALADHPTLGEKRAKRTRAPEPEEETEERITYPCYLSFIDGALSRHSTWPECEAQVKGRSGAKYKKVTSLKEELEVRAQWGNH
jgi:ribonuclease HI